MSHKCDEKINAPCTGEYSERCKPYKHVYFQCQKGKLQKGDCGPTKCLNTKTNICGPC